MDYKEKYRYALEWMKGVYPTLQGAVKKEAERHFPELKESEDERIRKEMIAYMKHPHSEELFPKAWIDWLEKQGEEGTNGNEREIPNSEPPLTIKHAREVMGIKQNPAWSEEDELMFISIIQTLKLTNGAAQMKIDWLKSLRPQTSWKPSDEQMEELHNVFNDTSAGWDDNVIESLYNDLKKLKG